MAFLPLLSICFPCNGNWYNSSSDINSLIELHNFTTIYKHSKILLIL
ncbi:hypothetical protein [Wolbachia endosymbiont (group B) of Eucosma cana]|nr:hypothetical protein [Wolbachia endosymbiont (group B) of Eucosma cana]